MTNHKPELLRTTSPIAIGRMGAQDEVKRMSSARSMQNVMARMANAGQ